MAFVLPLPSHSPLQRNFDSAWLGASCSSLADDSLTFPSRLYDARNLSTASIRSAASLPVKVPIHGNENTQPRIESRSVLSLALDGNPHCRSSSGQIPRKPSWRSESTIPSPLGPSSPCLSLKNTGYLGGKCNGHATPGHASRINRIDDDCTRIADALHTESNISHGDLPFLYVEGDQIRIEPGGVEKKNASAPKEPPHRRWLSVLRRNGRRREDTAAAVSQFQPQMVGASLESLVPDMAPFHGHRQSLSIASSWDFVTTVKTASMTLAGTSIAPRSRRGTRTSTGTGDNRNSRYSEKRLSEDSTTLPLITAIDEKILARSVQRHKILEELVLSEESYISDLRVLASVSTVTNYSACES